MFYARGLGYINASVPSIVCEVDEIERVVVQFRLDISHDALCLQIRLFSACEGCSGVRGHRCLRRPLRASPAASPESSCLSAGFAPADLSCAPQKVLSFRSTDTTGDHRRCVGEHPLHRGFTTLPYGRGNVAHSPHIHPNMNPINPAIIRSPPSLDSPDALAAVCVGEHLRWLEASP